MTTFFHVGDVHIGRERLGGLLPSQDFADAFAQVVDRALAERADFVLVAGDFFDRARIEPNHLSEGERDLLRLQAAGIPVVAIEGNHDLVSSWDDRPSWLAYLNARGLVRLLRTEFAGQEPVMREWTEAGRRGNWLDLAGCRIYGAGWFGASTARRLAALAPRLEKRGFTILLLHAGIHGQAPEFGMIDAAELAVVRDCVDYVALGHMHKRYVVDGYAHNPGSLESWTLDEAGYGDAKGCWRVQTLAQGFSAEHFAVARRPILRLVTAWDRKAPLVDAVPEGLDPRTVVQLVVRARGLADFDRTQLAQELAAARGLTAIDLVWEPAAVGADPGAADADLPRAAIEREEIEKLVAATGRYDDRIGTIVRLVERIAAAPDSEAAWLALTQEA